MLQELLNSINDPNGVTQDVWLHILSALGSSMPTSLSGAGAQTFGGRTYLTNPQKHLLRELLPYMSGASLDRIGGTQLSLPAHEPEPDFDCRKCGQATKKMADGGFMAYACVTEDCSYKDIKIRYTIEKVMRCGRCKGPFHPATGHMFNATTASCGICFGKFICWQMGKYGWRPLSKKQRNKLEAKQKKQRKVEEKLAKEAAKRAAKQREDDERLYGKPREAQYDFMTGPTFGPHRKACMCSRCYPHIKSAPQQNDLEPEWMP